MRDIDPETQCEIIIEKPKRRVEYSGVLKKLMIYSAMFGMNDFMSLDYISKKYRKNKDDIYYISLSRKEQKLPYEEKQDLKKLRYHLKVMEEMTPYQKIVKYLLK